MDIEIYHASMYISMAMTALPVVLLLSKFNRQPPEYKWLAMIFLFSLLCDLTNEILFQLYKFPVNIIGNIYIVFNPVFLGFFYYFCLKWKRVKIPLIILITAYVLFAALNFAFLQKVDINTYSTIVEKLLIMGLSILYYYKMIDDLPAEKIYHIGQFWIISAFFFTNSAKLVLFSFANYLVSIFRDNLILLMTLHHALSIIFSLIVTLAILFTNRGLSAPRKI